MARLTKKKKEEWGFFLSQYNRIAYNKVCKRCINDCKQSEKAVIMECWNYENKYKKNEKETC